MHTQTQCGPLSIYSKYKHRPFVNSRQCLRAVSEAPPGDGQYLIGMLCVGVLRPMSLSFHTYAADVLLSFYKEKRETRFFSEDSCCKKCHLMCADGWFVKDVFFFSFLVAEQRSSIKRMSSSSHILISACIRMVAVK